MRDEPNKVDRYVCSVTWDSVTCVFKSSNLQCNRYLMCKFYGNEVTWLTDELVVCSIQRLNDIAPLLFRQILEADFLREKRESKKKMEKKPDERETGTDAGRFWSRRPAEFIVCWLQQMHMQWTAGLVPLTLRPPFPPPACKRQRMNWTLDNIRGGRVQRWKWIFKFFTGRFIFSPNFFFFQKKKSLSSYRIWKICQFTWSKVTPWVS